MTTDAFAILDSFEYHLDGTISRYPEPEDFHKAMTMVRRANGMNMIIHRVLSDVFEAGIPVRIMHDIEGFYLRLEGFYKHGSVDIRYHDKGDTISVTGRYGILEHNITEPRDLTLLNFYEWQKYNEINQPTGWKIDPLWRRLMLKEKLIKESVTVQDVPA